MSELTARSFTLPDDWFSRMYYLIEGLSHLTISGTWLYNIMLSVKFTQHRHEWRHRLPVDRTEYLKPVPDVERDVFGIA